MTTSATTRIAAGISTSSPRAASMVSRTERRRGDGNAAPGDGNAAPGDGDATSPATAGVISTRAMASLPLDRSGQFADGLFQQFPRLLAVLALPLGVEAGGTQFFPE